MKIKLTKNELKALKNGINSAFHGKAEELIASIRNNMLVTVTDTESEDVVIDINPEYMAEALDTVMRFYSPMFLNLISAYRLFTAADDAVGKVAAQYRRAMGKKVVSNDIVVKVRDIHEMSDGKRIVIIGQNAYDLIDGRYIVVNGETKRLTIEE